MIYDINTIDELIDVLDGPSKAAELVSSSARYRIGTISPAGICNWKDRGYIPPSRHLPVLLELKRRGKTINPALLEMSQEDFDLLRA